MFRKADLVLLTKVDLLQHLDGVSLQAYEDNLARVVPRLDVLPLSARSGWGMGRFVDWLERLRWAGPAGPSLRRSSSAPGPYQPLVRDGSAGRAVRG